MVGNLEIYKKYLTEAPNLKLLISNFINMETAFKIVFFLAVIVFCFVIIGLFLIFLKIMLIFSSEVDIIGLTITKGL